MAETLGPAVARICTAGGFLGVNHGRNELRTWLVVGVAAAMMVAEVVGGSIFHSMALIADGWHMSTHAGALSVAALAYGYARRHATDSRFAFGTGKVGELAAFGSAVLLGVISLLIGWESVGRLIDPSPIRFQEATLIASLGLAVNIVSTWLLHQGGHDHGGHDHAAPNPAAHDHAPHDHAAHDHAGHSHGADAHQAHSHDNNLRAAYLHVFADAVISFLTIGGLLAGRYLGWVWMDPLIGILGALVIAQWSVSLMRVAGCSLLDVSVDSHLPQTVRSRLETADDHISDLHLWRLGPGHQALIVSIHADTPASPDAYKAKLEGIPGLSHITVEVNPR